MRVNFLDLDVDKMWNKGVFNLSNQLSNFSRAVKQNFTSPKIAMNPTNFAGKQEMLGI